MCARFLILGRRLLLLAAIVAALVEARAMAQSLYGDRLTRGEELFTRAWSVKDEKSPRGDGLGPLHNADSCIACHLQGGVGGAGPNSVNVQLLTFTGVQRSAAPLNQAALAAKLDRFHPGFVSENTIVSTIVVHRHSTERGYGVWRDDLLRVHLVEETPQNPLLRVLSLPVLSMFVPEQPRSAHVKTLLADDLQFELSERNTPALFGAALVNSVTDKLLAHLARRQAEQFPGITGRVPRSIDGRVGRFGWRGQVATLQDFVQNACAVELGLQLPSRRQAVSPMRPISLASTHKANKRPAPAHADMDANQLTDLMTFVMNLPKPVQAKPPHHNALTLSHVSGEMVFNRIGCATCHPRRIAKIDRIYSDLLLHDMGPELSDPSPAIPAGASPVRSSGYGGGSFVPGSVASPSIAELRREWRTPPLWGVRDSAPYLHDGRAVTLDDAIRAHGGEAQTAVQSFRALTALERDRMLAFLDTLSAP